MSGAPPTPEWTETGFARPPLLRHPELRMSRDEAALYGTATQRAVERTTGFDDACARAREACLLGIAACREQIEISRAAIAAYEEGRDAFDRLRIARGLPPVSGGGEP